MKKILLPLFVSLLLVSVAFGAWTYQNDLGRCERPHGVVVDLEGKVWIANYGPADSLFTDEGDTLRINSIQVWIPTGDGYEEVSFSPICILSDGSDINDTLDWAGSFSFRGASMLPTGEIIVMNKWVWTLDPSDGTVIERFIPETSGSLTNTAVDGNGYVYFGHVAAANGPVYILDGSDFAGGKYADAIAVGDVSWSYSRSMLVNSEGTELYVGTLGTGILNYHSDLGPDGSYTFVDTLEGTETWDANGMAWDRDGMMWVGSRSNGPMKKIHILDPNNNFAIAETFADTLIYPGGGDTLTQGSGFGFSLTGDTVYVADYDGSVCKVFTKDETGVWEHTETLIKGYALNQNYPNPFNPTTVIPFEIRESGFVQILVYDILGREVANLVNKKLDAGKHAINFDGSSLPAGTYIYRLKANGVVKTRKMSLVK